MEGRQNLNGGRMHFRVKSYWNAKLPGEERNDERNDKTRKNNESD